MIRLRNVFGRQVDHSDRLRVQFIVPRLGIGGAERHVATLMQALDPGIFDPSVVTIGTGGEFLDELRSAGFPTRALARGKRGLLLALVELVKHMRRTRPDVVVVRGANAELLGRIAAVLTGVPRTVVWIHNNSDLEPRPRSRRLADRLLERATSAYFGVAHGQRPYITEELGYPAEKVHIIHNGVELPSTPEPSPEADPELMTELGIVPDSPVVGIVAVLRPEKDHITFLHAARLVHESCPEARFLVVGEGALRAELHELADTLGIGDRVHFTGLRTDVDALLHHMDVVVLSSFTEAFPLAILEAMRAARPVVSTAVGGTPEMVDHGVTGFLVEPRDAASLGERVLELLDDADRARKMGRAGFDKLQAEFSLDRSVRQAEDRLLQVAGRTLSRV